MYVEEKEMTVAAFKQLADVETQVGYEGACCKVWGLWGAELPPTAAPDGI